MSTPENGRAPIADGTDITVSPEDLDTASDEQEAPATSDAEAMGQDDALGGTGGADAGGAG